MTIPEDEEHRFLNWQTKLSDCRYWANCLNLKKIDYLIASKEANKKRVWTIYKHMIMYKQGSYKEYYCCEEGEKFFHKTEVARLESQNATRKTALQ